MISTIDLDPKPVHRIPTWVMRKEEYLQVNFSLEFLTMLNSLGDTSYKRRLFSKKLCEFHGRVLIGDSRNLYIKCV